VRIGVDLTGSPVKPVSPVLYLPPRRRKLLLVARSSETPNLLMGFQTGLIVQTRGCLLQRLEPGSGGWSEPGVAAMASRG